MSIDYSQKIPNNVNLAGDRTIDLDVRDVDVPLSEFGILQAEALGRWFAAEATRVAGLPVTLCIAAASMAAVWVVFDPPPRSSRCSGRGRPSSSKNTRDMSSS